ncbi:uncharacterized protein LOC115737722 [Rhodamnia argentea]|uniref:Uncharacterized protein LOC115737722 n=1 Tax=Rhodamnia argentea TaxID=178133 RepID=A0A8B8NTM5_9MYRT|nr:uncharacterized protein LOC115737722 [Rhodamnia argentea]
MQELRSAARAHYSNNPDFSKAIGAISRRVDREFHNAVNYQAFVTLVEERSRRCTSDALFRQLDRGGKGHLDQDDLLVLYYLMDTRGDCSHCRDVLRSVYYTCLPCFDNCRAPNSPSFHICGACYRAKSFDHPQHDDFVDNYELLQLRRSQRLNWGELRRAVPQDVAAGLIVRGIEEACHKGEAIALQLGQTNMADDHLDQATDAASDAPGPDLDTDSWLNAFTTARHGWGDNVREWIHDFLVQ